MKKINFLILFLFLFFLDLNNRVKSKDYDSLFFTCADEIGPRLEFQIPKFHNSSEKKFTFKFFYKSDRDSSIVRNGTMKKKSSAIDDSYFFYQVNSDSSLSKKSIKIMFEFYPPSTLMIQEEKSQFVSLGCWSK